MKEPVVQFTNWVNWKEQRSLPGLDKPGLYMMAHGELMRGAADPLDKQIVYIGETCNNTLQGRWHQFHRSAIQGKNGHTAGTIYHETFGDDQSRLFVAAFPVEISDDTTAAFFIRYLERKLVWDYIRKWSKHPVCNRP